MSSTFDRETLAERFDEAQKPQKIGFVDSLMEQFQGLPLNLIYTISFIVNQETT